MKLFKKQEPGLNHQPPTRAAQRAALLDGPSLKIWLDSTIMGLGASFDKWRYHKGLEEEVTQHVEAITVIWDEIKKRGNNE